MNKPLLDTIFEETEKVNQAKDSARASVKSNKVNKLRQIAFPKILYKQTDSTVAAQKWLFNGFVINYDEVSFCIDPGADFLSRCSQSDIDLTKTNVLFISHAHIDHYASANAVSEQISMAGNWSVSKFLLPKIAIENKVISDYHRGKESNNDIPTIFQLEKDQVYPLSLGEIKAIESTHSIVDSFGCIITLPDLKIGYTGDTGYATEIEAQGEKIQVSDIKKPIYQTPTILQRNDYLKESFKDCDILICNLNSMEYNKHSKTHLAGFDVIDLVKDSNIKKIILTHLNSRAVIQSELNEQIARYIEEATGIKTSVVGGDGFQISLDNNS